MLASITFSLINFQKKLSWSSFRFLPKSKLILLLQPLKKARARSNSMAILLIKLMHYSFHSTPTCTFKSRNETITKSNQLSSIPGPADYLVKKPMHRAGSVSHITEKRNLYKSFQPNPGPGTYQAKSYITAGAKRSMSARYIDYTKRTPGPQDYDTSAVKLLHKAPNYSMGNKSKSAKQIEFDHNRYKPAPTNYNAKGTIEKKNGTFIGTSQRKDLTETQKTPAPNYYQTASAADFTASSNPKCKMGGENRKTEFGIGASTPGPAFYNKSSFIEDNSAKKKGYSCRQRIQDLVAKELSKNPAPGHYDSHLKNKHQAPRCSSVNTKRKTFMDDMQDFKKEYPGPGTHEPQMTSTKYRAKSASAFGKSNRKPLDQNQRTPGPVEYQNSKINLLNTAPKYSSTKTIAKNEFLGVNPENPGPGQYDPRLSLVKPNQSMYQVSKEKRPNFDHHRHTPGPGFYNLRGKQQGPTWKFPTEKRVAFTDARSDAKDGNQYEIRSKVVDPPAYMNVQSKIGFSPNKSMQQTGLSYR